MPPLPNMQVFEGSGTFVKPPSAKIASSRSGDVTLDFTDADIKDVVRAIFGEILQCSYTIDPRVTGHITLKTGRPIAKEAVLQALETALKISGYAINLIDDIYNIVPAESVQRRAQITYGANDRQNAGYGIEVISLEYVSAEEMQRIINPLVPEGAIAQIDAKRNLIFLSGSEPDRAAIRETIARFDVNYLKGMSFALIQPAHSNVETLASELDKIFGEANSPIAGLVRLIPMQRINSLLVITSRRNYLKEVQRWVARLDVAPVTPDRKLYFYRLQNSRAHDIAEILGRIFGGNMSSGSDQSAQFGGLPHPAGLTPKTSTMSVPTGSSTAATQVQTPSIQLMPSQYGNSGGANMPQIVTDEANNALIIRADAAGYAAIEDVVRQMDVPPSQVMVEATIVEVTLNDTLKYGVEWYFKNAKETYTMSPNGAVATHFPGLGITYSATNLQAALSTLGSLTDVTVISSPKILTLDNKAATIEVGDQIPIVTQTAVSTTTSGSPIVSSVEQRDTGVILSVTPRIGNSGIVYLDVSQEVSTSTQTTTSNIDSPTIQQRRIHSTVAVNDGATIALGGLIQNSQTNGDSGIPFLKDIPVLGAAFSTKSNVRGRTELLIFLTPHVIRNLPAALDMTEKLKQDLEKVRNALDELPKHRVPRRPW
ncbi:type II secretion system secretin GspD [Rhizomicrobium electricum]|uniref:type II secretion system secretin GspD n=1 Tax=Rhizomicrobium electricum TaxID=480070 RepID=UPI001424429A|nr:type II secretion system secretin GspD [Rhizomicrobium electricum]NIJ48772.1 general secretion pathway protein D [Rhizomicrobium electricum]